MAKPKDRERTSDSVARIAGQLLNGQQYMDAEKWLTELADSPSTTAAARGHANVLLALIASMRRVAASALTQR